MTMRWQKRCWTVLLLMSSGGTLALTVLSVMSERIAPSIWWIWPPLMLVAVLALIRCYRREPSDLRGFWHLRLEDLMCVGLYFGLLLAILKPLLGLWFPFIGIVFAFCQTIGLTIGFLSAQRRGQTTRFGKLLFAFAYGQRLVGMVAVGACVAVVLMDGICFNAPWDWMCTLWYSFLYPNQYAHGPDLPLVCLHQITLACLPVGMLIMFVLRQPLVVQDNVR